MTSSNRARWWKARPYLGCSASLVEFFFGAVVRYDLRPGEA